MAQVKTQVEDTDIKYVNTDINGKQLNVGDKVVIRDKLCWYDGEKAEVTKLTDYLDWYGKVVYNVHVNVRRGYNIELLCWPMQLEKE